MYIETCLHKIENIKKCFRIKYSIEIFKECFNIPLHSSIFSITATTTTDARIHRITDSFHIRKSLSCFAIGICCGCEMKLHVVSGNRIIILCKR